MSEHEDHDHPEESAGRVTSPMQEYTQSQVGIGIAVLLAGLVVTFAVPLVLA